MTGVLLATSVLGITQAQAATPTATPPASHGTIGNIGPGRQAPAPKKPSVAKAAPNVERAPATNGLNPTVTSVDGKYPAGGTAITPSGTAGKFSVSTTNGVPDHYVWALDAGVQTLDPPASQVLPASGIGGAAANAAGHWALTDGSGHVAKDSAGSDPASLSGGASWTKTKARGTVLAVDGSTGYAATAGPVVDTTQSYSVSAWVYLTNGDGWFSAVGQDGDTDSGFYLQHDGDGNWAFSQLVGDDENNPVRAESNQPAATDTWTHLVGVFDATSGDMTLYVNGVAAGTAQNPQPWAANGPLSIGRARFSGASSDFFPGDVSDVQVYQRALTSSEIDAITSATPFTATPQFPGPHDLRVYAVDASGQDSAVSDYQFTSGKDTSVSYPTLAAAYDNTGISPDNNPGLGDFDGVESMSATDLTNAGWKSGSRVTINGGTFTLPAYGTGQSDNVVAANQTIGAQEPAITGYDAAVPQSGHSALMFLTASTNTPAEGPMSRVGADTVSPVLPAGNPIASTYCFDPANPANYCIPSGTITYTDGSTQQYWLTSPDWMFTPPTIAALTLPGVNTPSGRDTAKNPSLSAFSVPLATGKAISSVSLPDVGTAQAGGEEAMHIFALATRNTTTQTAEANGSNVAAPSGSSWTASWTAPAEVNDNFEPSNFDNQTFRVALQPSISGGTVRVKLDDALGTSPLSVGHVTVAPAAQPTNPIASPSPAPTAPPVSLTFGGSQSVTIPQGGMAYSDPLPFTVTKGQYLLVSWDLTNSVPYLPRIIPTGSSLEYVTAIGAGDQTEDTTGSPFEVTGSREGASVNVVAGLDVAANAATDVVLGDSLIDAFEPNSVNVSPKTQLAEAMAAAEPGDAAPVGIVDEGIDSNEWAADDPETFGGKRWGGPAALSRLDRDILDQPNLRAVVIDEGLEDVLADPILHVDNLENDYTALISRLTAIGVKVVIVGLTPCDGYQGGGGPVNDPCSSSVDGARTQLNTWLAGSGLGTFVAADPVVGVTDTSNNEIKLSSAADSGDHVTLSQAGYTALANATLTALG